MSSCLSSSKTLSFDCLISNRQTCHLPSVPVTCAKLDPTLINFIAHSSRNARSSASHYPIPPRSRFGVCEGVSLSLLIRRCRTISNEPKHDRRPLVIGTVCVSTIFSMFVILLFTGWPWRRWRWWRRRWHLCASVITKIVLHKHRWEVRGSNHWGITGARARLHRLTMSGFTSGQSHM